MRARTRNKLKFQSKPIRNRLFQMKKRIFRGRIVDITQFKGKMSSGKKIFKTRAGPCSIACVEFTANGKTKRGMLHVAGKSPKVIGEFMEPIVGKAGKIKIKVLEGTGHSFSLADYLREHYPEIEIAKEDVRLPQGGGRDVFFDTATGEIFVNESGSAYRI